MSSEVASRPQADDGASAAGAPRADAVGLSLSKEDIYSLLQLREGCTIVDIDHNYRRAVRKLSDRSSELFRKLASAHDTMSDEQKRTAVHSQKGYRVKVFGQVEADTSFNLFLQSAKFRQERSMPDKPPTTCLCAECKVEDDGGDQGGEGKRNKQCRFFASRKGCNLGNACPYRHDSPSPRAPAKKPTVGKASPTARPDGEPTPVVITSTTGAAPAGPGATAGGSPAKRPASARPGAPAARVRADAAEGEDAAPSPRSRAAARTGARGKPANGRARQQQSEEESDEDVESEEGSFSYDDEEGEGGANEASGEVAEDDPRVPAARSRAAQRARSGKAPVVSSTGNGAGAAGAGEEDEKRNRLCRYLNTRKGCQKGAACPYKHDTARVVKAAPDSRRRGKAEIVKKDSIVSQAAPESALGEINAPSPGEARRKSSRPCRFFNTRTGCEKGDACPFRHDRGKEGGYTNHLDDDESAGARKDGPLCRFFNSAEGCRQGADCPNVHHRVASETPAAAPKTTANTGGAPAAAGAAAGRGAGAPPSAATGPGGMPTGGPGRRICIPFQQHGRCKHGANCRNSHDVVPDGASAGAHHAPHHAGGGHPHPPATGSPSTDKKPFVPNAGAAEFKPKVTAPEFVPMAHQQPIRFVPVPMYYTGAPGAAGAVNGFGAVPVFGNPYSVPFFPGFYQPPPGSPTAGGPPSPTLMAAGTPPAAAGGVNGVPVAGSPTAATAAAYFAAAPAGYYNPQWAGER